MNDCGDNLPIGFQGPVNAWSGLVPTARRSLRLPVDGRSTAGIADRVESAAKPACQEPAPRESADEPLDLIEVQALTESMGRVEDALRGFAGRLAEGGTLLLDVENLQSMRSLRLVLEGRPGSFDPAGSSDDPSQALAAKRVLAACAAAGLLVRDIIAVPAGREHYDVGLTHDMFARGLLPIEWLAGAPPARYWLVCERRRALGGSVVIAGGSRAEQDRTESAVRRFLPDDWEIRRSEAHRECAQWNRGIADARGELLWFLRGGSEPTAELFAAMNARAGVGAVTPGQGGEPIDPGDLAGVMMPRTDALLVGPLPENVRNTPVALEEHMMRLGAKLPAVHAIEFAWRSPPAQPEAPEVFAAEAEALVQRWQPLEKSTSGERAEAPVSVPDCETGSRAPCPWTGRRPRVSLCMIARDEERFLPECLERARAAVDEIIVVDTGSTDRTVAIAESFGAKVIHEPWQDDFSAPRNTAIAAATGDWILVLDADEYLLPGGPARIRDLVENAEVSGYHLHFTNIYSSGKTLGVMMVRLFRNLPGLAYQNVIHEQVTPSLQREGARRGLILSQADVEVEHHGYADEIMDARSKNERNERLFKKQMSQAPDDIYTHYKYGDFLRRVPGRGEDARALLERCLELILAGAPSLPSELPYAGEVAALCALETARLGHIGQAREILDIALRRFLPTPNLFYLSASIALNEGRAEDAITHYRRCLGYRDQVLVVPIQEGITSYVALTGIAQAWLLRGDDERAQRLLEQAIAIEPAYEVAHLALSKLWLQRDQPRQALQVLTDFLAEHPESPGACQQTTLILHRLGQTDQARRLGRHAVKMLEAKALEHEAAEMNRFLAAI